MSGKLFDGFPEKALVHGVGWCHISWPLPHTLRWIFVFLFIWESNLAIFCSGSTPKYSKDKPTRLFSFRKWRCLQCFLEPTKTILSKHRTISPFFLRWGVFQGIHFFPIVGKMSYNEEFASCFPVKRCYLGNMSRWNDYFRCKSVKWTLNRVQGHFESFLMSSNESVAFERGGRF